MTPDIYFFQSLKVRNVVLHTTNTYIFSMFFFIDIFSLQVQMLYAKLVPHF